VGSRWVETVNGHYTTDGGEEKDLYSRFEYEAVDTLTRNLDAATWEDALEIIAIEGDLSYRSWWDPHAGKIEEDDWVVLDEWPE
jgi:hypothetical protein